MVLRLYCLGMFKDKRPEISSRFFQVDLAPPIIDAICRLEGEDGDLIPMVVALKC